MLWWPHAPEPPNCHQGRGERRAGADGRRRGAGRLDRAADARARNGRAHWRTGEGTGFGRFQPRSRGRRDRRRLSENLGWARPRPDPRHGCSATIAAEVDSRASPSGALERRPSSRLLDHAMIAPIASIQADAAHPDGERQEHDRPAAADAEQAVAHAEHEQLARRGEAAPMAADEAERRAAPSRRSVFSLLNWKAPAIANTAAPIIQPLKARKRSPASEGMQGRIERLGEQANPVQIATSPKISKASGTSRLRRLSVMRTNSATSGNAVGTSSRCSSAASRRHRARPGGAARGRFGLAGTAPPRRRRASRRDRESVRRETAPRRPRRPTPSRQWRRRRGARSCRDRAWTTNVPDETGAWRPPSCGVRRRKRRCSEARYGP